MTFPVICMESERSKSESDDHQLTDLFATKPVNKNKQLVEKLTFLRKSSKSHKDFVNKRLRLLNEYARNNDWSTVEFIINKSSFVANPKENSKTRNSLFWSLAFKYLPQDVQIHIVHYLFQESLGITERISDSLDTQDLPLELLEKNIQEYSFDTVVFPDAVKKELQSSIIKEIASSQNNDCFVLLAYNVSVDCCTAYLFDSEGKFIKSILLDTIADVGFFNESIVTGFGEDNFVIKDFKEGKEIEIENIRGYWALRNLPLILVSTKNNQTILIDKRGKKIREINMLAETDKIESWKNKNNEEFIDTNKRYPSPAGNFFATVFSGENTVLKLWTKEGKLVHEHIDKRAIKQVVFNTAGSYVAVVFPDKTEIFDMQKKAFISNAIPSADIEPFDDDMIHYVLNNILYIYKVTGELIKQGTHEVSRAISYKTSYVTASNNGHSFRVFICDAPLYADLRCLHLEVCSSTACHGTQIRFYKRNNDLVILDLARTALHVYKENKIQKILKIPVFNANHQNRELYPSFSFYAHSKLQSDASPRFWWSPSEKKLYVLNNLHEVVRAFCKRASLSQAAALIAMLKFVAASSEEQKAIWCLDKKQDAQLREVYESFPSCIKDMLNPYLEFTN